MWTVEFFRWLHNNFKITILMLIRRSMLYVDRKISTFIYMLKKHE